MLTILSMIALFSGFTGESVSFAERADAIWSNPAGRAMHYMGSELRALGLYQDGNLDFGVDLSAGIFGLGYRSGDSTGTFTAGLGLPLGKRLRLGAAYFLGEQRFWRFGLQANPFNWMALGGTLETGDTLGATVGLGFRPFTDRVTVFSDLSYKAGLRDLKAGIGVEPVSGVLLYASYTQPFDATVDPRWGGGVELSFGNVKLRGFGLSYAQNQLGAGIDLSFSFPKYPGIKFTKPGPEIVEWTPQGRSEEPQAKGFSLAEIDFSMKKTKTFYDLLCEIRELGDRKNIKGLLLDFREANISLYQMEEVRKELKGLKEKGLKIIAFSEGYSIGSYYLASIADKIILVPTGEIGLTGLYSTKLTIKGTLNKLGIEPEFYRVGEYKAAYELFENSEASKEDREQTKAYLASIYDEVLGAIERDRGIARADFESYMNERIFITADTAYALGLVDTCCYALELDSLLKLEFGSRVERSKFSKLSDEPKEVPRAWVDEDKGEQTIGLSEIALVIAEGDIVTGKSSTNPVPIPLLGGKQMGSTTIAELLQKIKDDKKAKAVVFRINSGGGSALASEIINRALTELASVKPVIVSMGGVAGSGGYYIAAPGAKIFADATTVTGSIGILGGKFVSKGLYDKLGINMEAVKLYPHSDMFSDLRPFDEKESELMQKLMDQGYSEFVSRVAEGRKMTFEQVDSVARGRIWSGTDGVIVGLVDKVGGLMDALAEARKMAKLPENCKVAVYPKPKPMFDLEKAMDGALIDLGDLPSWLDENILYLMPYRIEVPVD
ncbi:signal peptide peptidase SppA [bacterium]|nr:signal peptide peptidase SppA [bacterium]